MKTIEFIGNYDLNSLVIGNHEPVKLKIIGTSQISGIVYMVGQSLELFVSGDITISLRGVCRHLILKRIEGSSTVDLTSLKIRELSCELMRGSCRLLLGNVRKICELRAEGDSTITMRRDPIIVSSCFTDNARIVTSFPWKSHEIFKN